MRATITICLMMMMTPTAWAGPPGAASAIGQVHESYARPGVPDWAGVRVLSEAYDAKSTFTAKPVNYMAGAAVPALFGWGTKLIVTSSLAANCCLAQTSTLTIGEPGTGNAFTITDANGPDGPGACFALRGQDFRGSGGTRTLVVGRSQIMSRPGARDGVCTLPSTSQTSAGDNVYPPCRVDGDCTDAGSSGTCDTTDVTERQYASTGAYIMCISAEALSNEITVETTK